MKNLRFHKKRPLHLRRPGVYFEFCLLFESIVNTDTTRFTRGLIAVLFFGFLLANNLVGTNTTVWKSKGTVPSKFNVEKNFFVENIGQYNIPGNDRVFYTAQVGEHILHFTSGGIVFEKRISGSKEELHERMEELEEGKKVALYRSEFLHLDFEKGSPALSCMGEEKEIFYCTFIDNTGQQSLNRASCYKKIMFKNVYNNIDFEFSLKEGGLKYNIILNPGADVADIKLKYREANSIVLTEEGHLKMHNKVFDLSDQSPVSTDLTGQVQLASKFNIKNNTVSFVLDAYNPSHKVIIDPWLVLTNTGTAYTPYEIDCDNAGNVYVSSGGMNIPELRKYNSSGVLQWNLSSNITNGDIAVNRNNGDVYMSGGFGAIVYKINTAGVLMATNANANNPAELWHVEYDHCGNQVVIGAGGSTPFFQGAYADPALANVNGVNMVNANEGNHDVNSVALDPNGKSCYMLITKSISGSNLFQNVLLKVPLAGLSPTAWQVPNAHAYEEFGTPYNMSGTLNGMACSWKYLYTYDGNTLKQWNRLTGAMVNSVVTGGTFYQTSGIEITDCGVIYVGVDNQVKSYNENLVLQNTLPLSGTCYDLALGKNNVLYACGLDFVQEIALPVPPFTLVHTDESCLHHDGTAGIQSCANLDSLHILWTPGGQTTAAISGLSSGWYKVTVSGGCGSNFSMTDSVFIHGPSNCSLQVALASDTICKGGCTNLQAVPGFASGPVTYQWNNGITTTGPGPVTVCPLTTTSYMVIATDSAGFKDTAYAIVTVIPLPIVELGNDTNICAPSSLVLNAQNPGMSYTWQNGTHLQTLAVTSSGVYWVNVHQGTCSVTDTIHVQVVTIALTGTQVNPTCTVPGSAGVIATGGAAPYSYNWSDGQLTSTATGLVAGTYFCIVKDAGGCSDTLTVVLTNPNAPVLSITSTSTHCFNGSDGTATVSASGGQSPYTYLWSNSQLTASIANLMAGNYSVIVTDAAGCKSNAVVSVGQPADIVSNLVVVHTSCGLANGSAQATVSGGTPGYTYLWLPGSQVSSSVSGLSPGTYSLTVKDVNGCTDTLSALVQPSVPVHAGFTNSFPTGCAPWCVDFTNTSTPAGTSALWNFGDGTGNFSTSPIHHCFNKSGTYTVSLTSSLAGCSDIIVKNNLVTVHAVPISDFTFENMGNGDFNFTDQSVNAAQWNWNFGDFSTSILQNPSHTFNIEQPEIYSLVTLIVTDAQGMCKDTSSKTIDIHDFSLFVPNSFTPDNNGLNDGFVYKGHGIKAVEMFIYDRWGMLIFESKTVGEAWNGTFKNNKVQIDTYIYVIDAADYSERIHHKTGIVNVIR